MNKLKERIFRLSRAFADEKDFNTNLYEKERPKVLKFGNELKKLYNKYRKSLDIAALKKSDCEQLKLLSRTIFEELIREFAKLGGAFANKRVLQSDFGDYLVEKFNVRQADWFRHKEWFDIIASLSSFEQAFKTISAVYNRVAKQSKSK